jgi:hypothetical protein
MLIWSLSSTSSAAAMCVRYLVSRLLKFEKECTHQAGVSAPKMPLLHPAQSHLVGAFSLVCMVLATLVCTLVPNALSGLSIPSHALALVAWLHWPSHSPFTYVLNVPDCVNLGIAPFHDDYVNASPSSIGTTFVPADSHVTVRYRQLDHGYVNHSWLYLAWHLWPWLLLPSCSTT